MSEVTYTTDPEPFQAKEEAYIATLRKEGRLLEDEVVEKLPKVPKGFAHAKEWRIRERNLKAFLDYWEERGGPLRILDLGCGNGWMSNKLAQIAHSQITGMDLNQIELDQAAKIFADQTNVRFVYGDIFANQTMTYNCIVLAATIQYFPDIQILIERLMQLLTEGGELHIFESDFYEPDGIEAARAESAAYYRNLGSEAMNQFYYHHDLEALLTLGAEILHNPKTNSGRMKRFAAKSPYYWLRFTKKAATL